MPKEQTISAARLSTDEGPINIEAVVEGNRLKLRIGRSMTIVFHDANEVFKLEKVVADLAEFDPSIGM